MARQCYKLNLNGREYKLRLTLAGQKNLLEKHPDSNILGIIMSAADDVFDMADLLHEALNWDGNENPIRSGEALYDEMVDAGYAGAEDFLKVVLNIAKNAGIISQENRDKLERIVGKAINTQMNMLFGELENGLQEPQEPEENPTIPPEEAEPDQLMTL